MLIGKAKLPEHVPIYPFSSIVTPGHARQFVSHKPLPPTDMMFAPPACASRTCSASIGGAEVN